MLSFATEIPLQSKYCAAADFFSRFEEFLRKCLRKDSNPLKIKNWRRGGIRTPGTGFSQYNGLANLFPKAPPSNPNNLEF
jgi:hypothetical protein